jgi:NTP pyrophosphatase (non-canonical NTP hydrolase)
MKQFDQIREWAEKVGIMQQGTPAGQYQKFVEECFEVEDAFNGIGDLESEIGDVIVTLVLFAELKGLKVEHCLQKAIDKNAARKGRMIGGKFVKEV